MTAVPETTEAPAPATTTCSCWCDSSVVVIPVEWVSEGRTMPCELPECFPECPTREGDAFDDPFIEEEEPESSPPLKRLMLADYDVAADCSPGTDHLRELYPGLVLVTDDGTCGCGCRETRSRKASFLPGHDAKLKGKLQRALAAELTVWTVVGEVVTSQTAAVVASSRGWGPIVARGAARIRERSNTPLAAEKRLARIVETERVGYTLLEFGRWDRTGRAMAAWSTPTGSTEFQYVTPEGTIETLEVPA